MNIEYTGNIEPITTTLKHIMLDKNIKQKKISEYTGLSKQTISNLLNNRNDNMTLDTLKMLCDSIGLKLIIAIEEK